MVHTDENGQLFVDDTPVYAQLMGGILHVMVRADSEEIFDQAGLEVGLLQHKEPGSDAVVDEEGNVIQEAVPPSGPMIATKGNTVYKMGPHVITPGVYDEEGNEVTPPVMDNRFHVNFWLGSETVERGNWTTWILQWMQQGENTASPNKNETSTYLNGIELIDPLSIETRSNVLL